MADLAVDLEREGGEVVTEREMRHHDETPDLEGGTRYAITLPSGGRHYPDLLVALPSGRYQAVEVELTPKNRARRERILTGYARARHIETVTYHVASAQLSDLIGRTTASLGIGDLVEIRQLADSGVAA